LDVLEDLVAITVTNYRWGFHHFLHLSVRITRPIHPLLLFALVYGFISQRFKILTKPVISDLDRNEAHHPTFSLTERLD